MSVSLFSALQEISQITTEFSENELRAGLLTLAATIGKKNNCIEVA
jgi:hypothetical protein